MSHTHRQIIGYTISDAPAPLIDRQISTYVATDKSATISVRYVGLFAVVPETKPLRLRQTGGYVVSKSAATGELRRVDGYIASKISPTGEVRRVDGYVLITPARAVIKNKTGIDALLDLMNLNAKMVFTHDTIDIGAVAYDPAGTVQNKNSNVAIAAKAGIPYKGTSVLYYDRIPLARLFDTADLLFTIPAATTIHNLIATINGAYLTAFVAGDFVDQAVQANAVGIRLTVANTSYMLLPGTQYLLGEAPTTDEDINTLIVASDMNGFEVPQLNLSATIPVLNMSGFNAAVL